MTRRRGAVGVRCSRENDFVVAVSDYDGGAVRLSSGDRVELYLTPDEAAALARALYSIASVQRQILVDSGPAKVLRVQSADDEPGAHWIERYFLRDSRGRYRELSKIPGNGQYAPDEDQILAWFRSLGVTHVEVTEGWHDSVPAKTYKLSTFARHLHRVAREALE